ncbi:MAG: DUF3576 domain-containing protein [Alphaproteobacteria bacterium]|nr:DUF3576 domain-containing protein [Alphaproteobacteria bacterium]
MGSPIKGYRVRGVTALSAVCVAGFVLAACEGSGYEPGEPQMDANPIWERGEDRSGSIFGSQGLLLFNTEVEKAGVEGGGGIGVNSFLWRASLDTISFMPVNSADPFGGVIITGWHATPETPGERFKLNVYILGRALRADGVRVAVFRQVQDGNGWRDAAVAAKTDTRIEDAILTKARQLRRETLNQ